MTIFEKTGTPLIEMTELYIVKNEDKTAWDGNILFEGYITKRQAVLLWGAYAAIYPNVSLTEDLGLGRVTILF